MQGAAELRGKCVRSVMCGILSFGAIAAVLKDSIIVESVRSDCIDGEESSGSRRPSEWARRH
jgi:hypothetical protein